MVATSRRLKEKPPPPPISPPVLVNYHYPQSAGQRIGPYLMILSNSCETPEQTGEAIPVHRAQLSAQKEYPLLQSGRTKTRRQVF